VSVKTDKRALTVEETQDRLQRYVAISSRIESLLILSSTLLRSSLMQGWKAATFSVPWLLQKTTNLGGSKHDKDKEEWEKKCEYRFILLGGPGSSTPTVRVADSRELCRWTQAGEEGSMSFRQLSFPYRHCFPLFFRCTYVFNALSSVSAVPQSALEIDYSAQLSHSDEKLRLSDAIPFRKRNKRICECRCEPLCTTSNPPESIASTS